MGFGHHSRDFVERVVSLMHTEELDIAAAKYGVGLQQTRWKIRDQVMTAARKDPAPLIKTVMFILNGGE